MKLSILELVRVTQETTPGQALQNARAFAIAAENFGYNRIWVAEHHNFIGIASAATSVVIGYLAEATKTIRIGAGGIMLPNHSPYIIAEQFGTLEHLYPQRIDLGLGRAPGTDMATIKAIGRAETASDHFPQDVLALQSYFSEQAKTFRIQAVPAAGTNVPLWILGSSLFGARLAAELGLPYSFASHFAPEHLLNAIATYKQNFKPSAVLQKPYCMAGINVIAAETEVEAKRLATTQQMSFTDMFRNSRGLSKPPIDDIENYWSPQEKMLAQKMLSRSVIGTKETIQQSLQSFQTETGVDEIIIVSDVFDLSARIRSIELISESMGLERPS